MANFTILAFCGGGIRGVFSAQLLSNLAAKYPQILTGTSMFAGTSTGSQIINMLVAGWSAPQIVNYYQTKAASFFHNPGTNPALPAYDIDEAYAGAVEIAKGNPKLSSFLPQQILMTSFAVGSNNVPWTPTLYGNTPNIPNSPLVDAGIADAATASSAMPGMLGSWKGMVDGAFVNHDPTLAAITVAVGSGVPLADISVITFGTGLMSDWIASSTAAWGYQQWSQGDGNSQNNTPPMYLNETVPSPIQNISLNGMTTNNTPMLTQMLLGTNYVNLNASIPYTPENDYQAIPALIAAANGVNLTAAEALLKTNWNVPPPTMTKGSIPIRKL